MIQIIVVSLNGGKVVSEETTIGRALSHVQRYLKPGVLGIREVKIVDGHQAAFLWRPSVTWIEVPLPRSPDHRGLQENTG